MADKLRTVKQHTEDALRSLPEDYQTAFIENYMRHAYKNETLAAPFFESMARSATGKGFLKERYYDFRKEALDAGLTPLFENPVENELFGIHQQQKYIAAVKSLQGLKDTELLGKFSPPRESTVMDEEPGVAPEDQGQTTASYGTRPPAGWVRLDDSLAAATGERLGQGQYLAAPEEVARLLNNYMSAGFDGKATFEALRAANGLLNQAQLGVSLFHFWATLGNNMKSRMALGFKEMGQAFTEPEMAQGRVSRFASGVGNVAKSLVPGKGFFEGKDIMQNALEGIPDPRVKMALRAGHQFSTDADYVNGSVFALKRAMARDDAGQQALLAYPAAMEAASAPLMQTFVPAVKLGLELDQIYSEMARIGPDITDAELNQICRRAGDHASDVMGQLPYDTTFWKKKGRQIGQILLRSLGWRGGTARVFAGGVKDTATSVSRFREAYKDPAAARANLNDPVFTQRMAYLPAELVGSLITGSIAAWGLKHFKGVNQPAQPSLTERMFPQTGGTNRDKSKELGVPPGYAKDVLSYMHDFPAGLFESLNSGEAPVLSLLSMIATGKNYRGDPIRGAPLFTPTGFAQTAAAVAGQAVPISLRNAFGPWVNKHIGVKIGGNQVTNPGSNLGPIASQFLTPAPQKISNPEKQQKQGQSRFYKENPYWQKYR